MRGGLDAEELDPVSSSPIFDVRRRPTESKVKPIILLFFFSMGSNLLLYRRAERFPDYSYQLQRSDLPINVLYTIYYTNFFHSELPYKVLGC